MISGKDVLSRPMIVPWSGPAEVVEKALQEAKEVMRFVVGMPFTPNSHKHIYVNQRGVMIGISLDKEPLRHIYEIAETLEELIGLKFDPRQSSVRYQVPAFDWPKLSWHQDGAGMDLKEGQDAVVSWVPLEDIDGTRPTLELAHLDAELLAHEREQTTGFLAMKDVPDDIPSTVIDGLQAGTAVLFSPSTPHRTYFRPLMFNSRVSMDLRFFQ